MNVYFENRFNVADFAVLRGTLLPGFSPDRLTSPYLHWGIPLRTEGTDHVIIRLSAGNTTADTMLVSGENIDRVVFEWLGGSKERDVYFETAAHVIGKANRLTGVMAHLWPKDPNQPMVLNSVYLGEHMTIPNLVSAPQMGDRMLSRMERSFEGFALGYDRVILKGMMARFVRIENDVMWNIRNNYIHTVGNVRPHWIDLYPEAEERFSAIWGTLQNESITYAKRVENPFFWDFQLAWMEAR